MQHDFLTEIYNQGVLVAQTKESAFLSREILCCIIFEVHLLGLNLLPF